MQPPGTHSLTTPERLMNDPKAVCLRPPLPGPCALQRRREFAELLALELGADHRQAEQLGHAVAQRLAELHGLQTVR